MAYGMTADDYRGGGGRGVSGGGDDGWFARFGSLSAQPFPELVMPIRASQPSGGAVSMPGTMRVGAVYGGVCR